MDQNAQQSQQSITPQPNTNQEFHQEMPQHSSMPKVMWMILGLLIILGLIGGAYYLGAKSKQANISATEMKTSPSVVKASPTPKSQVGWKTYADKQYGFSFQYPSNWSFGFVNTQNNSTIYSNSYLVQFVIKNPNDSSKPPLNMGVEIHNNVQNWTLNQWVTKAETGHDSLPQQQAVVGKYQGVQTQIPPDAVDYLLIIPIPNTQLPNALYRIYLYGLGGEGTGTVYNQTDPFVQQSLNDLNKVLSTFSFPMQNTMQTAVWKTYNNSDIPFSIQYPQTWGYLEQNDQTTGKVYAVQFDGDPKVQNNIRLIWGNGVGGGGLNCISHPTVQLKNMTIQACEYTMDDGSDAMDIEKQIKSGLNFVIRTNTSQGVSKNDILQVLATLSIGQ